MFIANLKDLKENMLMLDKYLLGTFEEVSFAKELIKNGIVFIYNCGRFYPSRWLGYLNNNMEEHILSNDSDKRDGRKTTKAISDILEVKPLESEYLNELYKKYCDELRVIPNKHTHKFWTIETLYFNQEKESIVLDDLLINKEAAKEVLSNIKKDPKYNKGFDPKNPKSYIRTGEKLVESVLNPSEAAFFKRNLAAFINSVKSYFHTHLYNCDRTAIVNEMEIGDFQNLVKSFDDGFEIMKRIQNVCSRSVYSTLTKLFNTYCNICGKGKNIYPKYDGVLREEFPKYYKKYFNRNVIIGTKLLDYPNYTRLITELCKKCGVTKDELDAIIWYKNK